MSQLRQQISEEGRRRRLELLQVRIPVRRGCIPALNQARADLNADPLNYNILSSDASNHMLVEERDLWSLKS